MLDQAVLGNRYRLPSGPAARGLAAGQPTCCCVMAPWTNAARHACGQVAVFRDDAASVRSAMRWMARSCQLRGKRCMQWRPFSTPCRQNATDMPRSTDHHRFLRLTMHIQCHDGQDAVKCASFAARSWSCGRGNRSIQAFRIVMEARSWTVVCLKYWFLPAGKGPLRYRKSAPELVCKAMPAFRLSGA